MSLRPRKGMSGGPWWKPKPRPLLPHLHWRPATGSGKMPGTQAWVPAQAPDQDPADSRAPRVGEHPGEVEALGTRSERAPPSKAMRAESWTALRPTSCLSLLHRAAPQVLSTCPTNPAPHIVTSLPGLPASHCTHGAPPLHGNPQRLPTAPNSASCPSHPGNTCPGNLPLLHPPQEWNCPSSAPTHGPQAEALSL